MTSLFDRGRRAVESAKEGDVKVLKRKDEKQVAAYDVGASQGVNNEAHVAALRRERLVLRLISVSLSTSDASLRSFFEVVPRPRSGPAAKSRTRVLPQC